jgi:hypothetical protein
MNQGTFVQYKKNLWIVDETDCLVKLTGKNRGEVSELDNTGDRKKLVRVKVEIIVCPTNPKEIK